MVVELPEGLVSLALLLTEDELEAVVEAVRDLQRRKQTQLLRRDVARRRRRRALRASPGASESDSWRDE